jgi:hypothetical protein
MIGNFEKCGEIYGKTSSTSRCWRATYMFERYVDITQTVVIKLVSLSMLPNQGC